MKRGRYALTMVILSLFGCGNDDSEFIERAKAEATKNMRDPSSVQFRNIEVAHVPKVKPGEYAYGVTTGKFICGELNEKTGSGGYTEFRAFYAAPEHGQWVRPDADEAAERKALIHHSGEAARLYDQRTAEEEARFRNICSKQP